MQWMASVQLGYKSDEGLNDTNVSGGRNEGSGTYDEKFLRLFASPVSNGSEESRLMRTVKLL